MKDDTKRLNSTEPKSKVLVRMESAVSSVTSTQEIIETTSSPTFNATARAGKIRAMISNCSKRMLVAIICLLSIGVLTVTTLYVMEYHKKGSITTIMQVNSELTLVGYQVNLKAPLTFLRFHLNSARFLTL